MRSAAAPATQPLPRSGRVLAPRALPGASQPARGGHAGGGLAALSVLRGARQPRRAPPAATRRRPTCVALFGADARDGARSGRACAGGARRAWRGVLRHARALLRPQACVLRAPRLRMSRALCALPALPALRLTHPARADYRIVLLDQRGCGRSAPLGCLDGNNTDALVHPFSSLSHKQRD